MKRCAMQLSILAVHPQDNGVTVHDRMPPLGMLWIAGHLRASGFDINFLDQQVDDRDLALLTEELKPDLVLIGGTTHSRFAAYDAAALVKEAAPSTCVVYGGPHASFTSQDTLHANPAIDITVRGEGEETSLELAQWIQSGQRVQELPRIKGIAYRDEGTVIENEPRRYIEDLNMLEMPARDLVPMERYGMTMDYMPDVSGTSLITARGCPVRCTFCSAAAMFGSSYRMRSPRKVVDEIEAVMNTYGFKGIKIFDSTFTLNRNHVEEILDELEKRRMCFPWECEIRANTVTKDLLARMQKSGCYYVDLGVESGSQRVLDHSIHKGIRIEEAEQVLRWTSELGIKTKAFFCIGHPGETLEEGRETLRMIRRNSSSMRMIAYRTGIHIYPGTYVYNYANERNLLPEEFSWSKPYRNDYQSRMLQENGEIPLLIQPQLGVEELRQLRLEFIRMRLLSPRFLWEKLRWIISKGLLLRYLKLLIRMFQKPT